MRLFEAVVILAFLLHCALCRSILELQGLNFEVAIANFKYIAIIFYDDSPGGVSLESEWTQALDAIDSFPHFAEVAKVNSKDANIKEIIEAYGISVPSVKIFRRGIINEYRGPTASLEIVDFLIKDVQPSITKLQNIKEMKAALDENNSVLIFGLFSEDDIVEDDSFSEGYSIEPWGQFQASADTLRGYASFYLISSKDLIGSFKLKTDDMPAIFIVNSEKTGFLRYSGEILEMHLNEWILKNSSPHYGELSFHTAQAEIFTTQFFSARKLKFILFLQPDAGAFNEQLLDAWKKIADEHQEAAMFGFLADAQSASDVVEYFQVDPERDAPLIIAHRPLTDHRYRSARISLETPASTLLAANEFVESVLDNKISITLKSEAPPKHDKGPVKRAVGSTLLSLVSQADKDVLLLVYTPWCAQCRKLLTHYDMLGRAVEADSRIVVAMLDGQNNDFPLQWKIRSLPAVLWFPASDKPYPADDRGEVTPSPQPYWEAGFSLQELVAFVQRHSSFDKKSLRIATIEQLASLLSEEEAAMRRYEKEEWHHRRNEGRSLHENWLVDLAMGEIVFDGTRLHIAGAAALTVLCVVLTGYVVYLKATTTPAVKKKAT